MDATAASAPEPTDRLFLSLALPDPVRRDLAALQEPAPGVSWTPAGRLHLTLRFLGEVPLSAKARLVERLAPIKVAPFILPIEGTGAFPPRGPARVLWAGTGSGHPHLFQLRQRIDDAILGAGLEADLRHFHPHVTLGRVGERGAAAARSWLRRHAGFSAPPLRVDGFDLCLSLLSPAGAEHSLVRRFALGPGRAGDG